MDYIQSDSGIEGRYLNSGEMIFRKGLQELRNRWGGAKAARGRANDQQVRLTQLICRHLAGRQRFDISF